MKIALLLNDDFSMLHFRGGLIKGLVKEGHEVTVIVPPGDHKEALEKLGAKCLTVRMQRFFAPWSDFMYALRLFGIFRRDRFDIVHTMTVKPNILGTMTAKLAGVKRVVCLVSGLGFPFEQRSTLKDRFIGSLVRHLYRVSLHIADKAWFQNPDNYAFFVQSRIIPENKGIVIRSGGIDTEEFRPSSVNGSEVAALKEEFSLPPDANCVLMVLARLVWSKGVREYVESAQRLWEKYKGWYFILIGPQDANTPDAVPDEYMVEHRSPGLIFINSFRYDVKSFIAMCQIMVLPSYYLEGVPRSLLEGLAMAKPIVTTDNPGCREVVDEGKNGYLVPVKNTDALCDRIERLINSPEDRELFGRYSREKVESEFSETLVVNRIIRELYQI